MRGWDNYPYGVTDSMINQVMECPVVKVGYCVCCGRPIMNDEENCYKIGGELYCDDCVIIKKPFEMDWLLDDE